MRAQCAISVAEEVVMVDLVEVKVAKVEEGRKGPHLPRRTPAKPQLRARRTSWPRASPGSRSPEEPTLSRARNLHNSEKSIH